MPNIRFGWSFYGMIAVFTALLVAVLFAVRADAAINPQITFYGTLQNSSGTNLDGTYDMVFRFYDAASGGTLLDTSTHTAANSNAVSVSDGEFTVLLGSGAGNTLDGIDFDTASIYVGLSVEGDAEMTPRERLTAAPYAFNADQVDGYDATDFVFASDPSFTYATATTHFALTGTLTDGLNSAGTNGYVLQTTGGGVRWVATSSLGISGSNPFGASVDESELNIAGGPTDGYVLQASSTAAGGFVWVATSTLNITAVSPFGADIGVTELASADFGDFTCNGVTCTLDASYLTTVDISDDTNLSVSATGLQLSGDAIAAAAGYAIPLTASTTEWATAYGWGDHAGAGYLSSITASDLPLDQGFVYAGTAANQAQATSSMFIDADGDVGIGTTTPQAKLHVSGGGILFDNTQSIYALNNTGLQDRIITYNASDNLQIGLDISGSLDLYGDTTMSLNTGGIQALFIDNSQQVGIASSSPVTDFAVGGDVAIAGGLYDNNYTRGSNGMVLQSTGAGFQWIATSTLGLGTVTSVGASVPAGWTVTGSPVTNNGTLAFAYDTGYAAVLTASTTEWATAYGWGDHSGQGYLTSVSPSDLSLTQGYVFVGNGANVASATSSLFINAEGEVGINTTNPLEAFHVNGNILLNNTQAIRWRNNAATANTIMAYDSSNNLQIGSGIGGNLDLYGNTATIFNVGGSEYMRLLNTGRLGVGDATSDAMLEVSASGGVTDLFMLSSDDANDGNLFIVKNNGNVGIGTTSPATKLDVWGGLRVGTTTGTVNPLFAVDTYSPSININTTNNGSLFRVVNNTVYDKTWAASIAQAFSLSDNDTLNKNGLDISDIYTKAAGSGNATTSGYSLNVSRAHVVFSGSAVINSPMANFVESCSSNCISDESVVFIEQRITNNTGAALDVVSRSTNGGLVFRAQDQADDTSPFVIDQDGNVGIASATPAYTLTVDGDIMGSGRIYDNSYSAGSNGMVLQTTGTGFTWVATGTLGFTDTDTTLTTGSDNQIPFTNAGGTDFDYSSSFAFNGSSLSIGGESFGAMLSLSAAGGGVSTGDYYVSRITGSSGGYNFISNNSSLYGAYIDPRLDAGNMTYGMSIYGVYAAPTIEAGAYASSSYAFYGAPSGVASTTWGIYLTGEDQNYFSGNVGVGTTSPTYPLTVYSSTGNPLLVTGSAVGGGTVRLHNTNSAGFSGFNVMDETNTLAASFQYGNTAAASFTDEMVFASRKAGTDVVFYQGGVSSGEERLRFDSSGHTYFRNGNIGIGTTSPAVDLHVAADGTISTPQFMISGSTNPLQRLMIGYDTTSDYGYIQPILQGTEYKDLALNQNGGNVGIGTTTPNSILTIETNSGNSIDGLYIKDLSTQEFGSPTVTLESGDGETADFRLYNSANTSFPSQLQIHSKTTDGISLRTGALASAAIRFVTNNLDESMIITQGGNVGIGTSSPSALLTVGDGVMSTIDGTDDLYVTDDIEVDGSIYVAGASVFDSNLAATAFHGPTDSVMQHRSDANIAMYLDYDNDGSNNFIIRNGSYTDVFLINEAGTVASGTWNGAVIDDAYISDTITASNYLPLTGGDLTGDLDITISGGSDFNRFVSTDSTANYNTYIDTYNNTLSKATTVGLELYTEIADGATSTNVYGASSDLYVAGGATNASMYSASILDSATSNLENMYGLYISEMRVQGNTQNRYGLYLDDFTGAPSGNDFGIYQADAVQDNYFAGSVGIGTSSPNTKLTVAGEINIDQTTGIRGLNLNSLPLITGSTTKNTYFLAGASSASFTGNSTYNYAIGAGALQYLGDGAHNNIGIGGYALRGSSTGLISGDYNIALGEATLQNNATGKRNIALGQNSLNVNDSGDHNLGFGLNALVNNVSGDSNFGFGASTLYENEIGSYNTAIGWLAMFNTGANAGLYNNAIGYEALYNNSGTGTIAIGFEAARNAVSVDRGIFIGFDIDAFSTTQDDVLNIGNLIFGTGVDGTGTTISSGGIGIGTTSITQKLTVAGDIQIGTGAAAGCIEDYDGTDLVGTCPSDERLKQNITALAESGMSYVEALTALTPVTYNWNELANETYHKNMDRDTVGLIAQDVESQFPDMVVTDENGYKNVRFTNLPFYIIQAIKEIWEMVTGNSEKIESLEDRIEALEAELGTSNSSSGSSDEEEESDEETTTTGEEGDGTPDTSDDEESVSTDEDESGASETTDDAETEDVADTDPETTPSEDDVEAVVDTEESTTDDESVPETVDSTSSEDGTEETSDSDVEADETAEEEPVEEIVEEEVVEEEAAEEIEETVEEPMSDEESV